MAPLFRPAKAPTIPSAPAPDPEVARRAAEDEAKRKRRAGFQSLLRQGAIGLGGTASTSGGSLGG